MSDQPSGLVLHHLEASRSIRILWMLEELNIPYEVKHYKRNPVTKLAGDDLKQIHPLGRSPVLTDGELVIIETNAIYQHLLLHYYDPSRAQLGPALGEKTQASVDLAAWIQFSEASIMLHTIPFFYLFKGGALTQDGSSAPEKVCARGLRIDMLYLEDCLSKNNGQLISGHEFTAADCAMFYSVDMVDHILSSRSNEWRANLDLQIGTATKQWLSKSKQRPAFITAIRKEGVPEGQQDWLQSFFTPAKTSL